MGKRWLEFLLSIATLVSAALSIVILFRKALEIELASKELKVAHKTKVGRLCFGIKKHCGREIKIVVIVFFIALILSLVACFSDLDVPSPSALSLVNSPTPTSALSNTPTPLSFINPQASPLLSPTPIYTATYLCDLEPLITKSDAFFTKSWNAFDDFIIGQDTIQHGIGIQIPEKDRSMYLKKSSNKRVEHVEYIEYSLGRKYKQLDFEFGVDRSSLELLASSETPACLCRIVMQDVPSNGFVNSTSNMLFDSDWFNYRLARHAANIGVSDVETIRITVYWQLDVNPTKETSLRLVLIDPELRNPILKQS